MLYPVESLKIYKDNDTGYVDAAGISERESVNWISSVWCSFPIWSPFVTSWLISSSTGESLLKMIVSITLLGSLIRLQLLHFCHSCKFSFFGRVTTREQVHVCGHSSSSSFSSAWTSFYGMLSTPAAFISSVIWLLFPSLLINGVMLFVRHLWAGKCLDLMILCKTFSRLVLFTVKASYYIHSLLSVKKKNKKTKNKKQKKQKQKNKQKKNKKNKKKKKKKKKTTTNKQKKKQIKNKKNNNNNNKQDVSP